VTATVLGDHAPSAGPTTGRLWTGRALSLLTLGAFVAGLALFWTVDRDLADFLKRAVHGDVERFFKVVTNLGRAELYLVPAGLAWAWAWMTGRRVWARRPAYVFLTMTAAGAVELTMKYCLGRMRPKLWLEQGLFGFRPFTHDWAMNSLPSGHSQAAWAGLTALAVLYPKGAKVFFALALLIAVSRVMLTVHWASDALAGAWLGFTAAMAMAKLYPPVPGQRVATDSR
jgi:membrane-associated phospholipid phosphatase